MKGVATPARKKSTAAPRAKARVRSRPMRLDEITLADMPTPAEIRRLRKISAEVVSGKRRVRYVTL